MQTPSQSAAWPAPDFSPPYMGRALRSSRACDCYTTIFALLGSGYRGWSGSPTNSRTVCFINRKHKICHSERSEESAGARARGLNGVIGRPHTGGGGGAAPANPDLIRGATDSSLRLTSFLMFLLMFIPEYSCGSMAVGSDR